MKKFKKRYIALLASGVFLGSVGFNNSYFEISKNLEIFTAMYKEVNNLYVEEIEPNQFVRSGLDAMLNSLDPYTNFISEQEVEDFRFQTTGTYGGIGALVNVHKDTLTIMEPYENGPTAKAGLRAGDRIIGIDGKNVTGIQADEYGKLLKGQANSTVKLRIFRPNQNITFEQQLNREDIHINSISYHGMIDENIAYIKLSAFRPNAGKEMVDAFTSLKKQGAQQLVIDLRDNPGGSLDEAVRIAAIFVPKFSLVVDTRGKNKQWDKKYTTNHDPIDTSMPITVLVNENSASASEIIAGVLQDYDRAIIMGQKSFGKGLVQTVRPLPYNNQIKVTTARFYTPSGRCIQAIDYVQNGKDAQKKPDSLQQIFYTKNKRPVYDAGGIKPDIAIEEPKLNLITQILLEDLVVFEFCNKFRNLNDSLPNGMKFGITDAIFESFKQFADKRVLNYETDTEKLLQILEKEAKREQYYASFSSDLKLLRDKLKKEKDQDLDKHKSEIKRVLENELVARYYLQTGRVVNSFKNDPEIIQALTVLGNTKTYNNVLKR